MRDWRSEVQRRLTSGGIDPAVEGEIVEELAQHLEDQFAELRARGVSADRATATLVEQLDAPGFAADVAARRRARGGSPALVGGAGDAGTLIASMWQDVRYGLRSLRKSPAFASVAILSIALGIGATTAIFSLLHTVLFERLAVARPQQLVSVQWTAGSKKMMDRLSFADFTDLSRTPGLPRLAGAVGGGNIIVVGRKARDYFGVDAATPGYLDLLGVRPLLGRVISKDEDANGTPVVVVSQDYWERSLGGDPAAVGEVITMNDRPFTVIGVLPRSFHGILFGGTFSFAIPLLAGPSIGLPDVRAAQDVQMAVIGRLSPSMTRESASAAMNVAYQQCCAARAGAGDAKRKAFGDQGPARPQLALVDASRGIASMKFDLRREYARILIVLMAGVSIVLLIACANVGNLLLARAAARQREIAVRMSMGASRARLFRQLLTECLEIAVAGGVLGLWLARLGTSALSHNLPPVAATLANRVALRPSLAILAFTAVVTVGCTILFGVLPTLRAIRTDIMTPLKDGAKRVSGRAGWTLDRGLVVGQIALALVLVCAATLFVATLRNLREFDGGYGSSHVLLAGIDTRGTQYESRGMNAVYPDILARVAQLPGVQRVAAAGTLPVFGGRVSRSRFTIPGYQAAPDERIEAWNNIVTPGFFAATGIGLRAGREFDARDTETNERVTIINQAFAKRYFAGRDPIGASFLDMRIVGVANDARYSDLRVPAEEWYYRPITQAENPPFLNFALRTAGDPVDVAAAFLREVEAVTPGIRIRRLAGVEQALNEALSRERLTAALAFLFGLLALGLAAVGLYGVVAYNVARRTSEIGIRMALGARPADALWLVVRQTLAMTAVGLGIGVPLALLAARAIGAQLYGIGATDPRALLAAASLLALVGAAASIVPGRRAASVDPVEALRNEG